MNTSLHDARHAAAIGDIDNLKHLYVHDAFICSNAAANGHLNCLLYAPNRDVLGIV